MKDSDHDRACGCADREAITRLLHRYADCLDAGRFEDFAGLFRNGTWIGNRGYDAVLTWLNANIRLYEGIPSTHHVVTNACIDVAGDRAVASSYLTVVQHDPDAGRLEVITVVRYEDVFARVGSGWVFRERTVSRRFVGDNSRHRRPATTR